MAEPEFCVWRGQLENEMINFFPSKVFVEYKCFISLYKSVLFKLSTIFFKLNYLLLSIMIKIKKLLKEKRCLKIRKNKNR